MDKEAILKKLMATAEYKMLKKGAKRSVKVLIPIIIVFFVLSLFMAKEDLFAFGSILIYFMTFVLCFCLVESIKRGFIQEEPIQYDISTVKKIKKLREHKRLTTQYLVTLDGNEIWAEGFAGNCFDCSKIKVGSSVIVFKYTANSIPHIVSNE